MKFLYSMLLVLATTLFANSSFARGDGTGICEGIAFGEGGATCNLYCGEKQLFGHDLNCTDEENASGICPFIKNDILKSQ